MEWSDQYATGIPRLDDQHKTLFKMVGDFRAALEEGHGERVYGDLLQSLDAYARTHFGFEEGVMIRHQCPASEKNKEAHDRFVALLAGFQEHFARNGFERAKAAEVVDTLEKWLRNHIGHLDVQLRDTLPKA